MRNRLINTGLMLVALLSGSAALAAGSDASDSSVAFDKVDSNHDGAISLEESIAAGTDDLAFRAMDINGDSSVSPEEYAKRKVTERNDPSQDMPSRPDK